MKQKNQKHSEFWDTVQDIKRLTQPHLNKRQDKFKQGPGKKKTKGTKMPLPILKGARKHIMDNLQQERKHNIEHDIQYRSDIAKDMSLLQKRQKKTKFQKNQYKFDNMNSKKIGKFKNGYLQLNERDVQRIKKSR